MEYLFEFVALQEKSAQGIGIDEAELTAAEEGMRRITPSSPDWQGAGVMDPEADPRHSSKMSK